ncbi:MAG: hypothetical protein GQ582_13060 [Methyloprofundus sp.]|nr:hypothetical protein [Methyloprofundus sp.]
MSKILIPASNTDDWKQLIVDPEKQWKSGYSARSLAYCWQESGEMPADIVSVLEQALSIKELKTIFAIPEHKVALPGGSRASQNDVWVLAASEGGLISIAIEGKVAEPFGQTVGEWFKKKTKGKEVRLKYLCAELCLEYPPPLDIRYQLLHRTVSAIIEAKRLHTNNAAMVVHSFSKTNERLDDYQRFLSLFNLESGINQSVSITLNSEINLTFAWVHGSEKYLKM